MEVAAYSAVPPSSSRYVTASIPSRKCSLPIHFQLTNARNLPNEKWQFLLEHSVLLQNKQRVESSEYLETETFRWLWEIVVDFKSFAVFCIDYFCLSFGDVVEVSYGTSHSLERSFAQKFAHTRYTMNLQSWPIQFQTEIGRRSASRNCHMHSCMLEREGQTHSHSSL